MTECSPPGYEGDRGFRRVQRFYENNSVISVSNMCGSDIETYKDWFYIGREHVGAGNFEHDHNRVSFLISGDGAEVSYQGRITRRGNLKLKLLSLTNGYKGKIKLKFFEVDNLGIIPEAPEITIDTISPQYLKLDSLCYAVLNSKILSDSLMNFPLYNSIIQIDTTYFMQSITNMSVDPPFAYQAISDNQEMDFLLSSIMAQYSDSSMFIDTMYITGENNGYDQKINYSLSDNFRYQVYHSLLDTNWDKSSLNTQKVYVDSNNSQHYSLSYPYFLDNYKKAVIFSSIVHGALSGTGRAEIFEMNSKGDWVLIEAVLLWII